MLALARMIHPASGRRACWRVLATSFTITSWRTKALRRSGIEARGPLRMPRRGEAGISLSSLR